MRNGQNNNKRMRNNNRNNNSSNNNNNNNNNRRGQNPMTRVYESNGPDIKIRGTASHIAEKYLQLARDSRSSSDPVAAENYYQHAEHYFRLIATAQEQFRQNQPQQQNRADNGGGDMQMEEGEDETENFSNFGAEPGFAPQQREQLQQREQQPQREQQSQPRERDNYQPRAEQPYPREARQPQPQYQPQPAAAPAADNIGLPSFITGGASQPAPAAPFEPNGPAGNGEPRFPPRRRRRPHGPRPDAAAAPATAGDDFNPGNS